MTALIWALLASPFISVAHADEEEAETCLRTKIWDGYNTGWAVRTATKTTLGQAEHRVYLVTLYAGNEYKVLACGDKNLSNIDIVLYDKAGAIVTSDTSVDREPMLTFTPTTTDTYYVAVHATKLNDAAQKGGIATAVTYK
jgi:hypothetical protein